VRERFANGVFFVSLAAVSDSADVLPSIAQVLGVEIGSRRVEERLAEDLRVRSLLLVLDNFEHVARAAPQIAALIAAAPRLKVLATSQASLRIGGEREYAVGPLAISADTGDPGASADSPAVALFLERARAVKPSLRVTAADATSVAEICRQLDGLPLAIELAAARIKTLAPAQILQRLGSRLTLLRGGARDLPARQQTLRDTIAWSVDLLEPPAAALFRRFAVFSGGATIEALEGVLAGEDDDPLGALDVLVDHNLIIATETQGKRFEMLQTIREFALDLFEGSGDAEALRRAHASYFAGFAERADAALRGAGQGEWRLRLAAELANFRAALAWCFDDASAGERSVLGARLAAALGWFWYTHADAVEGCRWLDLAHQRAQEATTELRARVLSRLGILHDQRGDFEPAARLFESALAAYRELGDQVGVAASLNSLGSAARNAGDTERARNFFEESLSIKRSIGDAAGEASSTHNLAVIALDDEDGERAREMFERCIELDAASGNEWGVSVDGCGVADALLLLGDLDGAEARVTASLRALAAIGERDWTAEALSITSGIASSRGDFIRAARLDGAAWATWKAIGFPPVGKDLERHFKRSSAARAAMPAEEFERARADGEAMTFDQAVEYALRVP
jgi:predicted ATPase